MENGMKKYEELYNYSKYAFDEEISRFGRIEDKAARFMTVVTSLLAVYALIGRQLFGELIPAENCIEKLLLLFAALTLISILASWGFVFRAMYIQRLKKAPLNDELISFYDEDKLIDIYYAMSKQFSISLAENKVINDWKAKNIARSFWCIVGTVVFLTLFIVTSVANANFS